MVLETWLSPNHAQPQKNYTFSDSHSSYGNRPIYMAFIYVPVLAQKKAGASRQWRNFAAIYSEKYLYL